VALRGAVVGMKNTTITTMTMAPKRCRCPHCRVADVAGAFAPMPPMARRRCPRCGYVGALREFVIPGEGGAKGGRR
jgi:hypothetical protein